MQTCRVCYLSGYAARESLVYPQILDEQGTFKAANFARLRETFGLTDTGEEEVVVAVDSREVLMPCDPWPCIDA